MLVYNKGMEQVGQALVKKIYLPPKNSHKGQNGKLTIIGGSKLFHGASLWALKTASRIVDMVFYATVPENVELTRELSAKLYDFICVPREEIENYIEESEAILIGPGMVRTKEKMTNVNYIMKSINEIKDIENEGVLTYHLTKYLLKKYPNKKWIIDAGALQMMKPRWLKDLKQVIITPHKKEFINLFNFQPHELDSLTTEQLIKLVSQKAKEFDCVIILKGKTDIICSPDKYLLNHTGNEGMTKGGTGDVLAGLIAALACKNDPFTAASVGAYINGLAGDALYKKVGPYFNASDLCDQIPTTLWNLVSKGKEK